MADLAEPLRRSVAPHDRTHNKNRAQSGWGVLPGQMHTRQTRGWGVLLGLLLASLLTQLAGEYSSANLLQPAGEYSSASYLHHYLLNRLGSTPRLICYYYLLRQPQWRPRTPSEFRASWRGSAAPKPTPWRWAGSKSFSASDSRPCCK